MENQQLGGTSEKRLLNGFEDASPWVQSWVEHGRALNRLISNPLPLFIEGRVKPLALALGI